MTIAAIKRKAHEGQIAHHNAKYVMLPVWVRGQEAFWRSGIPNPHANSSIGDTVQQWPLGTKFVDGDRVFFYGYTSLVYTANKANVGMFNLNIDDAVTFGATSGVKGDEAVGIIASGLSEDTTPLVDAFAGGWFMPRTNPYSSYRVIGSSLSGATVSGEVDLYLDHGLIEAVSGSVANCYVAKTEFGKMYQHWAGGLNYVTCVGVTLIDPIASTWQWVQSWGPCYVVPYNDEIGGAVSKFLAAFHIDGSVRLHSSMADLQIAGYMIPNRISSTTATWLIRLQVNR